jgi:hypothetical protein
MSRTVVLELAGEHELARDLVAGGVFVRGEQLSLGEECSLVLRGLDEELVLAARAVFVNDGGTGLQIASCDGDMKAQIARMAQTASGQLPLVGADSDEPPVDAAGDELPVDGAADEQPIDGSSDDQPTDAEGEATEEGEAGRKIALNVNERLRGLTLVQQIKVAQHGEISERIILERMYGKTVWEALLRNPRITGPEVARIARMGSLPRPMIELIVGNGGWLQVPEVRRALLSNPRLGTDQILRVLRLLPKHELKLAGMQTAYPFAVRDAAKRMLREMGVGT